MKRSVQSVKRHFVFARAAGAVRSIAALFAVRRDEGATDGARKSAIPLPKRDAKVVAGDRRIFATGVF